MAIEHSHHAHGPGGPAAALSAGGRHRRRLLWSFGLIAAFFVVELVAGLRLGSLALLSDAGHMLTDVAGLGMALAAIQVARQGRAHPHRSFGLYRLEILAALVNAVLLFGVAAYVLVEALGRIQAPTRVLSTPLLVVAVAGLGVNLLVMWLLYGGSKESLNVRGAYLEVFADTLGSVGVIVAAVIIATTGWVYADPLIAAAIGLFILPRAWRLAAQTLRILLQAAPHHIDLGQVQQDLLELPDVVDAHDVHVWTLTSDMDVASAHLMVRAQSDMHAVLDRARHLLAERHHIVHATLQVEPETHEGCEELSW